MFYRSRFFPFLIATLLWCHAFGLLTDSCLLLCERQWLGGGLAWGQLPDNGGPLSQGENRRDPGKKISSVASPSPIPKGQPSRELLAQFETRLRTLVRQQANGVVAIAPISSSEKTKFDQSGQVIGQEQPRDPSQQFDQQTLQDRDRFLDQRRNATTASDKETIDKRPARNLSLAAEGASHVTLVAGLVIDRSGLILTEYHAVHETLARRERLARRDEPEGAVAKLPPLPATHFVWFQGRSGAVRARAKIRAADPRSGLAVLALASPLPQELRKLHVFTPPTQLAGKRQTGKRQTGAVGRDERATDSPVTPDDTSEPQENAGPDERGRLVVVFGNPHAIVAGEQASAAWGSITNTGIKISADSSLQAPLVSQPSLHRFGTLWQTDAKIGLACGGGAAIDMEGNWLGLTTSVAVTTGHEQSAGYIIPMTRTFQRVVELLKRGKEVEYGLLGITFGQMTQEIFAYSQPRGLPEGVRIDNVYNGSPADRAGLRRHDQITQIGNRVIHDADELQLAIGSRPPGSTVKVKYRRRQQTQDATVTLAKLYVEGPRLATERPVTWRGIAVDYATALSRQELSRAVSRNLISAEGCVLIRNVLPNSPAWNAGLRQGEFVSHVGTHRVSSPADFRQLVQRLEKEEAAQPISLRLTRDGGTDMKIPPAASEPLD